MTLFYNALFYSLKERHETFSALLVDENGVIVETFQKLPNNFQGNKIDLNGTFVYPGFVDTHTHSFEGGLYSRAADLGNCRCLEDVYKLLQEREPIDGIFVGYNFDENLISEKRFPAPEELDRIFPNAPCLIRRIDGHSVQINSKAKKEIEQWGKIPLPEVEVYRGDWNDHISRWFHRNISQEEIISAYQRAAELAILAGHTTVHTMVGDAKDDPLHYKLLQESKKKFSIEFVLYPQIFNIQKALELGAPRVGGCILADGSFGSGTAALSEPYINDPQNRGILYKSSQEWEKFILEAHENGLQVAIHCIGDAAIKQILSLYAQAQQQNPKNIHHQIIHSELITDDRVIDMMKEYHVAAVMQPVFDLLWGGEDKLYAHVIGKDRALQCNRFRSLLAKNVLVTGGSDWYVTEMNALKGIYGAVNHHNTTERIDPFAALSLYTINAARLINEDENVGMLTPGRKADLVCLDRDLLQNDDILSIKITRVVKAGKIIH
ncbi:MAG: amidohydrolase [Candidatus Cloacimonetes bacterium]|nr:amidohydrolase [Candidatus Cloacimonadota bacterium]